MNKKTKIAIFSIFIFAVIFRMALYIILGRIGKPAFWEYHTIAMNFLEGKGLLFNFFGVDYYAYAEPFYPLLSALVYILADYNYLIFGVINILASGLLVIIIFFLATRLFDEKIGMVAAVLTAVHPGLIYFSTEFHPLTFNALFITVTIFLLIRVSETLDTGRALLAGLSIALAFLDRSIALIFIPLSILLILTAKGRGVAKLKVLSCIFAVVFLAVAGWTIRNYAVFHKIVIARSSSGYLFWLGNNPNYTGSAMYSKNVAMLYTLDGKTQADMRKMDEIGQNRYFTNMTLSYVKQKPFQFLARWAQKFYYFWWFSPQTGFLYPAGWLVPYKIFYTIIIFSAIFSAVYISLNFKKMKGVYPQGIFFTIFCCLSLAAAQSLFYIEGRHRWVIEPIIMIFSSWALIYVLRLVKRRIAK